VFILIPIDLSGNERKATQFAKHDALSARHREAVSLFLA